MAATGVELSLFPPFQSHSTHRVQSLLPLRPKPLRYLSPRDHLRRQQQSQQSPSPHSMPPVLAVPLCRVSTRSEARHSVGIKRPHSLPTFASRLVLAALISLLGAVIPKNSTSEPSSSVAGAQPRPERSVWLVLVPSYDTICSECGASSGSPTTLPLVALMPFMHLLFETSRTSSNRVRVHALPQASASYRSLVRTRTFG